MFGDASVVICGCAGVTVRVSVASLHRPLIGALLTSPLYVAIQRYVPAIDGVKFADWAVPPVCGPLSVSDTVDVNIAAPVHAVLPGA